MEMLKIPKDVKYILNKLENHGFEAFIVGGSVRDFLLDIEPKDFDIATSAKPDEVIEIFSLEKIVKKGIEHGTITIHKNSIDYEVTTYRRDGEYKDYRRPSGVTYTQTIKEDLSRRDFTINAMAYNEKYGLVDPFDGKKDLHRGIIKCVGNGRERFREDPLRILRGIRHASILGFQIETFTANAMRETANLLLKISKERIREEFIKIILGKNFKNVGMEYREILAVIIPEIKPMFNLEEKNQYQGLHTYRHTLMVVDNIEPIKELKLAAFFHNIGKPQSMRTFEDGRGCFCGREKKSREIAEKIMERLKFDKKTKNTVAIIVEWSTVILEPDYREVGRLLQKIGYDNLQLLILLQEAEIKGQKPEFIKRQLENIELFRNVLKEYLEKEKCFSLRDLAINGNDLKEMGYKEGEEIGRVLKEALEKVMEGQLNNSKKELVEYALINQKK